MLAEMTVTTVVIAGGRICLISRCSTGSTVKLETGGDSSDVAWVDTLGFAHGPDTAGRARHAMVLAMLRRTRLSARGLRGVSLASCLYQDQYTIPSVDKQAILTVVTLSDAVLNTSPLC